MIKLFDGSLNKLKNKLGECPLYLARDGNGNIFVVDDQSRIISHQLHIEFSEGVEEPIAVVSLTFYPESWDG